MSLRTFDAINAGHAFLVAVGPGKLDDRELHVDLMSQSFGALFFVKIIYHQCGMNHSRDPAKQGQKDSEKETPDPAGHQYRQRWQHHTEKISQRFHFCFFLMSGFLRSPFVFTSSYSQITGCD